VTGGEAFEVHSIVTSCFGEDTGNGNLLGIQPHMVPIDYASEERLYEKFDGYLRRSQAAGFVGEKTVVVLPEYLGVWLVAAGEKDSVYSARTVSDGVSRLVASKLVSFMRWLPFAGAPERARRALFYMKARSMAAIYHRTFSRLAREHGVTIVAGSIVLPDPRVADGVLCAVRGPLYNASVVYGPDGRARTPLVRKAFPIEEELRYLSAGSVEDLPVFETPAGRLGVLVCADSWHPEPYERLREKGAEIIAVPSFLRPDGQWGRPWEGCSGAQPPDIDPADEGRLSEAQAWMKYALPGRMAQSGARAGINVFLRGRLWDLGSDGQALAVLGDTTYTGPDTEGGALVNLWLGVP
jgi:hypothetical protein